MQRIPSTEGFITSHRQHLERYLPFEVSLRSAFIEVLNEHPHIVRFLSTVLIRLGALNAIAFNLVDEEEITHLSLNDMEEITHSLLDNTRILESIAWSISGHPLITLDIQEKLIETVIDELDNLAQKHCPQRRKTTTIDRLVVRGKTAVGVLIFNYGKNVPSVLLIKNNQLGVYDCFNGDGNSSARYLLDEAINCVATMSSYQICYTRHELLGSFFHDYLNDDNFLYRLYISKWDNPIDLEKINGVWVPLAQLEFMPLSASLKELLSGVVVKNILQNITHDRVEYISHTQRSAKFLYTRHANGATIVSPQVKKWQLTDALIKHSCVVAELKSVSNLSRFVPPIEPPQVSSVLTASTEFNFSSNRTTLSVPIEMKLSPSQYHMKAILGNRYQPNNLADNIMSMMKLGCNVLGVPVHYQEIDYDKLHHQYCALAQNEIDHPDKFYLYHGCNSQTAFIYTVYTAIYQILNAENQRQYFRADIAPFDRYASLAGFVSAFNTANGIFDNYQGYNELCMSTNVFLFGGISQYLESSVQFFVENHVIHAVEIENVLLALLKPLGVSEQLIARLASYFDEFNQWHGSALYQIAIDPSDVQCVVYSARKWGLSYLPQCFSDMHKGLSFYGKFYYDKPVNSEDIKIAKELQARFFATPEITYTAKCVSYTAIAPGVENPQEKIAMIKHKIKNLLCHILHDVLASDASSRPILSNQATLFRQRAIIRKQHGVPLQEGVGLEVELARAITLNHEQKVIKLLTLYPSLKYAKLNYNKPEISGNVNLDINNLSVLEIYITMSTLPMTLLTEIYGSKWWQDQSIYSQVPNHRYHEIIKSLNSEERVEFVNLDALKGKLSNQEIILHTINLLPAENRVDFLNHHKPANADYHWFSNAAHYLEGEDYRNFVMQNAYLIPDSFCLDRFMSKLKTDANKVAFIKICQHLTIGADALRSLQYYLSDKNILDECHFTIRGTKP